MGRIVDSFKNPVPINTADGSPLNVEGTKPGGPGEVIAIQQSVRFVDTSARDDLCSHFRACNSPLG